MNGHEEDFGDFPSENKEESTESLIGAYRAESTLQLQQEVESQQKFHHFLMGLHPGLNTRS